MTTHAPRAPRVLTAAAAALLAGTAVATPAAAGLLDKIFGPPIGQQPAAQTPPPAPAPQQALPAPRRTRGPVPARAAVPAPAAVAPRQESAPGGVPVPLPRPGNRTATEAPAAAAPPPAQAERPAPAAPAAAAASRPPMSLHPAASAAPAATAPPRPRAVARDGFTAEQVDAVQRVDAWFNSVSHLVGDFTQVAPNGARSHGRFYLLKPGKVRFNYAQPSPLDIVCDGVSVAVLDRSLKTQQTYPLSETPLRYLLKPDLDLFHDAQVTGVSAAPRNISITVEEHSKLVGTSRLRVVFAGQPLVLTGWTITDPQGLNTTVSVGDLNTRQVPPSYLFTINYLQNVPTYR